MAKKINWNAIKKDFENKKKKDVQSFFADSYGYLSDESTRYDESDYDTTSKNYEDFLTNSASWRSRAASARKYVEDNKDVFGGDYQSYVDYVDAFSKSLDEVESLYKSKSDYMSGFANKDAYDFAVKAGELDITSTLAAEKEKKNSAKQSTEPTILIPEDHPNSNAMVADLQEKGYNTEIEKNNYLTKQEKAEMDALLDLARNIQYGQKFAALTTEQKSEAYNAAGYRVTDSRGKETIQPLTEDEHQWLRKNYYDLLSDKERDEVYRERKNEILAPNFQQNTIISNSDPFVNRYETEVSVQNTKDLTEKYPLLMNAASVVTAPMKAFGAVGQLLDSTGTYIFNKVLNAKANADDIDLTQASYIDPYSDNFRINHMINAVREETSKNMGGVGKFAYNTGMSILENGFNMLISGGNPVVTRILMGSQVASDTILDAKQRGLSDFDALALGGLAGVAEALFEKYSIESLMNAAKSGGAGVKNFVLSWLKQSGVEASEEFATEIANIITDSIISGDLSEYNLAVKEALQSGLSYDEAKSAANKGLARQVGEAAAAGFISGGVFGFGGQVTNALSNRFTGNDIIKGGTVDAVLNQAEGYAPDSATGIRYTDYQNKTKKGGKASPSYVGAVYRAMTNDSYSNLTETAKTEVRSYIENQLAENGIEANGRLVDAIEKKVYAGENLTKAEEILVNSSEAISSLVEKFETDSDFKSAPFNSTAVKEAEEKVGAVDRIATETTLGNAVRSKYNVTDNAAEIESIDVKDNGDVYLVQNGESVEADKAKVNTDTAFALAYSEGMSASKKRAFFSLYTKNVGEGKMSIDDYQTAFDLAYTYGQNADGIDKAIDMIGGTLSDEDILTIYKSGLDTKESASTKILKQSASIQNALNIENRPAGKVDDSLVRYRKIKSYERRAMIGFANVVASVTGRNVKFYDSTAKMRKQGFANGYYDPKTDTIYLDVNAGYGAIFNEETSKTTLLQTLSHELVHIFRSEDSEGFAKLKEVVFDVLTEQTGNTKKTLIDNEVSKIQNNAPARFDGRPESVQRAIAEEEIVARACEDMLAETRLMKEFMLQLENKEAGLAQTFSDMLGLAIKRLKKVLENIVGIKSNSDEAKLVQKASKEAIEKWTAIKEQYDALLERRTEDHAQAKENTSVDSGVMMRERYDVAIDKLDAGKLDRSANSHLKLLDHTPSLYIDKADAKDLKIVVGWDIAYLAMKKSGELSGNYHGLGADVMKKIPDAIKHPLYIVKQKNGRIAAVTEIIVKGNRSVIVSLEFDTFKSTIQNGLGESENYNLIVTILDAKHNYLKNNIFAGDIVYNKNNEAPANFILRLKSLKKALPNDDLARASKDSIPNSAESVKQKQLEIINSTNPAPNTFQTWIRKTDDIRTWDEVLALDDEREGQFVWGDFSRADAEQAKKDGTITVYSSYPIKNGVFVSTSRIQAQDYAGGRNGRVYSKTIPLTEVAWINGDEGQYAKVSNSEDVIMKQDRDSEGNQLTEGQLDYFKDSKIVDANGNLKVMYHGSKESFTVFDKKKAKSGGTYGNGFYFTDSDSHAKTYGETYAVYLNITNPLKNGTNEITKDQLRKFVEAIADNEDYGIENYGYGATVDSVTDSVYGKSDFAMIMDINMSCVGNMVEAVELFNEVNGTDYNGIVAPTETVAFYPEQIKSVANKNPTSDADIRYQNRNWHTGMSNKEVARIEELAKHQQNKPENHIDSMHKWLYDERGEKPYFALYSLSDTDPTPTVLYASKGEQAKFENIYVNEYILEEKNGRKSLDGTSERFDKILRISRNSYYERYGNVNSSVGRKSDIGDAKIYRRNVGRRPSQALLNCIRNIEEIQSRGESSGVKKQDRVPYQSARDILLSYAEDAKNVKARSEYLNEYVERVKRLDLKNRRYEDAVSNLATAVDSGNKEKIDLYQKRVENLEKTINQMYADLQAMEDSKELKAIVRREKAETKKQTKREGLEKLQEYRDNQERKSRIDRIEAKVSLLGKKILANNKELHIPDALKEPILDFIEAIDYTSKKNRSGRGATIKELRLSELLSNARKEMMKHSMLDTEGGTVLFSADIWEQMDAMEKNLQGFRNEMSENVLLDMSTEQLRDLDFFLSSVTRALNSIERSFANSGKATVYAEGEEAYKRLLGMKDQKQSDRTADGGTTIAGATKAFTWGNMTPQTAFNRLGKAGEAIYRSIVDGWGEFAFKSRQILDFAEQNWNAKQVKAWENAEHEIEFEHDGKKEKGIINDTQLMYLYLVDKREQGRLHLDGLGITLPEQGKSAKSRNIEFNYEQRQELYDKYIPEGSEQRKVADAIQRFFVETCAKWGNETSLALYGYTPFKDQNYVPLVTDTTTKGANAETSVIQGMYAILNMGFMKSLQANANNPIVATNLFDVFANHSADMAKYNALGRPILDAVRFLNFNRVDIDPETGLPVRTNDTLRAEIDLVYGSKATKYFEQFLIDLNGNNKHQSDDMESLASKMMQNFKIAAVSFSLKSISIQTTSYFRATKVLSVKSMSKALALLSNENGEIQVEKSEKYRKLAQQYSGMAAWKSLGYFDVNIGRSLTEQVKGTKTFRDKAIEQGTKGMAFMDEVTIGALYKACLIEVNHSADAKGLSAEEIRKKAGKLLDEVIVKTQVVDSTVTRSQNMRSKSFFTKSISAFMSEPTVSLNLLMDAMYGYTDSVKQGMGKWESLQANRRNIGRSIATYALTGVASALLEAVFGALRDDDDEEFYKKYLEVFPKSLYENLAVHTKIPYLSDADELAKILKSGYVNISRMEYEGINDVFVALRKGYKLIESDDPITTEKLYAFLKALFAAASSTTGIAFGNILREIEDAWNNTFGAYYNMKLRTK